ncbi:MAG: hypothetical protein ACRDXX_07510, partial [Stackebrandtia sp.]
MYQPSQHDDGVDPDHMVRSQFGAPHAGGNGSHPGGEAQAPETWRYDPSGPRRRRYAVIDEPIAPGGPPPEEAADEPPPVPRWTVARSQRRQPEPEQPPAEPEPPAPPQAAAPA